MARQFFWLAFRVGDDYTLSPYWAESRQEALRYGMEHVLDQELAAVFGDELGFTEEQMLVLAQVLPPLTSPMPRPPEAERRLRCSSSTEITPMIRRTLIAVMLSFVAIVPQPASPSRSTRINRLRRNDATWTASASRYGVSSSTVRRGAVA